VSKKLSNKFDDPNGFFPRLKRLALAISLMPERIRPIVVQINETQKMLVHKDTWSLWKSIRFTEDDEGFTILAGGGGIINPKSGKEVDYGHWLEMGHGNVPPYPYFYPGYDKWKDRIKHVPRELVEWSK